ncbi:response regulator [Chromatiaceae bacterium AAb-1]|nr:response regulator [Chromatiaceae bacterium AAb-1]
MIFQSSFYKSKKILLIEDYEPVRASIKGMLQQIGFENITSVADAAQAMAQAARKPFDFILADFELGDGKDALQLFDDLKQQSLLKPGCCFAVMSAEPRRLPIHGMIEGIPDGFLLKPFTYIELEKRLAKALQSKLELRKVYLALHNKDLKEAQLQLDEVIKTSPAYTLMALRLKAEMLLAAKDYNAAHQLYSKISQQRDFNWAHLGSAIALLRLEQYAAAEQALQGLLRYDDTRPEVLDWLIRLYLQQQDLPQAEEQMTELLKLWPKDTARQHALGILYLVSDKADDAIRHWQKLIQQYRFSVFDSTEYYLDLARLLTDQCQSADIAHFNSALRKADEVLNSIPQKLISEQLEPQLLLLRARLYLLHGRMTEARDLVTEHEFMQDDIALPVAALADKVRLLFALGNLKQAEHCLEQLRNLTPGDDLTADCQRLLQQHLLQHDALLRAKIREWNQGGIADADAADYKAALIKLRQAFMYMPYNTSLAINLLHVLSKLPPHKALTTLARTVLNVLEFQELPPASQQKLALIKPLLPELYTG